MSKCVDHKTTIPDTHTVKYRQIGTNGAGRDRSPHVGPVRHSVPTATIKVARAHRAPPVAAEMTKKKRKRREKINEAGHVNQ